MSFKGDTLFLLAALLCLPTCLSADIGTGIGISPGDSTPNFRREKKIRPIEPFIKVLAKQFHREVSELGALSARGYGRNELIKLLLMAQKSGKDLKDLVKLRDKNTRLSAMADMYHLDYPELLSEAESVRKDIDFKVPDSTGTIAAPRPGSGVSVSSAPSSTP